MQIEHVEIGNFRKLLAVRIDFAPEKTVFVGANNSGKTSAMVALRRFLVDPSSFSTNDITLSHCTKINATGREWDEAFNSERQLPNPQLEEFLPFLDVWLNVSNGEWHFVRDLIPTLDWRGGLLGLRLRYEPDKPSQLQEEFVLARKSVVEAKAASGRENAEVTLWPKSLLEFLERKMRTAFKVKAYLLDPAKLTGPVKGEASPQALRPGAVAIDGNPLAGLIRVDAIEAQRGFGQAEPSRSSSADDQAGARASERSSRRLSAQLRAYFDKHLDPSTAPSPDDLDALSALEMARTTFDSRLQNSFSRAFQELETLGYPGMTDPVLTVATKFRLTDGLNHDSAVQYSVRSLAEKGGHSLPEDSNGLGFQNLVSIVFRLMSYRDAWMRVGKASSQGQASSTPVPPLQLVLVEEPEAYLHAQVQQVFIKQAYDVLRNHPDLGASSSLTTQLIVSTHSSNLAYACDFASLRYFRRHPELSEACPIPTSRVINLSEVFGKGDSTAKFVARYIRTSHCDLFFADAAVFVEGSGERILIPYLVNTKTEFEQLRRSYITWLEVGGSHAHRFRSLIEHLGLTSLIITDLDAKEASTNKSTWPRLGEDLRTRNETLKSWVPGKEMLDELVGLSASVKVMTMDDYSIRVAYQTPAEIEINGKKGTVLANTFEDALLYKNIEFFRTLQGSGLIDKFRHALANSTDAIDLPQHVREALKEAGKGEFALDLLFSDKVDELEPPAYISEGLSWLADQLQRKDSAIAPKAPRQ